MIPRDQTYFILRWLHRINEGVKHEDVPTAVGSLDADPAVCMAGPITPIKATMVVSCYQSCAPTVRRKRAPQKGQRDEISGYDHCESDREIDERCSHRRTLERLKTPSRPPQ